MRVFRPRVETPGAHHFPIEINHESPDTAAYTAKAANRPVPCNHKGIREFFEIFGEDQIKA